MKKIGITGQIGAGKSYIGSLLRNRGFKVMDSDAACHELYRENQELRDEIAQEFGQSALMDDGINRKFFADLIFRDSGARIRLEKIVYPHLVRHTQKFLEDCAASDVFVEAALFENVPELVKILDEIWVVTAPEDVRRSRLVEKRGLTLEDANRRLELQKTKDDTQTWRHLFEGKKIRFINNDGVTVPEL